MKFRFPAIPTRFYMADGGEGGNGAAQQTTEPAPKDDKNAGKTFTQADLDKAIKDRLDRERKKYADYEDIKAKATELDKLRDGQKTEIEKAQEALAAANKKAAEAEAKVKASEIKALKISMLTKAGLAAELADRVRGETEEDIKTDIDALKKFIKPNTSNGGGNPPANPNQGVGEKGSSGTSAAKRIAEAAKTSSEARQRFFKV